MPYCNIPPLERKQHLTRSEKNYARSGAVKDRSFPRAHSLTLKSQRKTNASTTPTHTTHLHPQPSCGCETEPSESLRAPGAGRDTQTRPGPEESWGGSQLTAPGPSPRQRAEAAGPAPHPRTDRTRGCPPAQPHLLQLVLDLPPAGRHLLGGDHRAVGRQGRAPQRNPARTARFRPVTATAPSWERQGTLRMRRNAKCHLKSGLRRTGAGRRAALVRGRLECGWRGRKAHAQKKYRQPPWVWRTACAAILGRVWCALLWHPFSAGMYRVTPMSAAALQDTRGSQRPPGGKPVLVVLQEGCGSQAQLPPGL